VPDSRIGSIHELLAALVHAGFPECAQAKAQPNNIGAATYECPRASTGEQLDVAYFHDPASLATSLAPTGWPCASTPGGRIILLTDDHSWFVYPIFPSTATDLARKLSSLGGTVIDVCRQTPPPAIGSTSPSNAGSAPNVIDSGPSLLAAVVASGYKACIGAKSSTNNYGGSSYTCAKTPNGEHVGMSYYPQLSEFNFSTGAAIYACKKGLVPGPGPVVTDGKSWIVIANLRSTTALIAPGLARYGGRAALLCLKG
jgi:hypothetical protein